MGDGDAQRTVAESRRWIFLNTKGGRDVWGEVEVGSVNVADAKDGESETAPDP